MIYSQMWAAGEGKFAQLIINPQRWIVKTVSNNPTQCYATLKKS